MTNKSTRTPGEDTQLAVMANDLKYIKADVKEVKTQLSSNFVPLSRYILVERIVFGMVGLVLITVVGALMALVVRK